ncbi:hypothetical protein H2248_003809 [Termitomyces sp. 'cryptogamus']|nr:hypothetical protein H2248_003809 [Termitomyces sp. 'cryptogamus']
MLPTEISDLGHHQIHGSWTGLFTSNTTGRRIPYQGLMRISFQNQPNQGGTMSGVASHSLENMDIKYVLNQTDNTHYDVQFLIKEDTLYIGVFDTTSAKITGHIIHVHASGRDKNDYDGSQDRGDSDVSQEQNYQEIGVFQLSRTPESLVSFRYTDDALRENPAKSSMELCMLGDTPQFFLRPGESESIQPSHAMHTMLWIRNDQDAHMPVRDTLTRLEGSS